MRNLTNIIAAVMAVITLAFIPSLSGFCAITNWNVETAAATYVSLVGTPIRYEGTVIDEDVQSALAGWYATPEELRNKMKEIGTVIYISDSATTDTCAVGSSGNFWKKTNGVYSIKSSYIIIRTTDNDEIYETTLHEIGHVIDRSLTLLSRQDGTTVSESAEWTEIYNNYAEILADIDTEASQNMYNCYEAFAETYRLYIEKPDELLSAAPAAYAFMADLIAEYTSAGQEAA